jgi:hypothetical protein
MHRSLLLSFLALSVFLASGAARGQEGSFRLDFQGPAAFEGSPGTTQELKFLCTLESTTAPGAHGWNLSIRAEGAEITSITTDGTVVPDHLNFGFVKNEITTGAGNEGAISSVLLSLSNPDVTLPPQGTFDVAVLGLRTTMPAVCSAAKLRYFDGLRNAEGQLIDNTVIRPAETLIPALGMRTINVVPAGQECTDVNGAGWIETAGWNLLFPLTNPYGCDAGGPENMLRNWVAPHQLTAESPRAGAQWGDIDFQGVAVSTGFEMADVYVGLNQDLDPVIWTDLKTLNALPGVDPASALNSASLVDYQAMLDHLNLRVVPNARPYLPLILSDNVLGIAQTYVHNVTSEPICVDVCTRSDDSIQVWINDRLITNVSACRGISDRCAETNPAVLDPGVNRVTVLTWEGTGGWGFGLSLQDREGRKLSNLNQDSLLFAGTDPKGAVPASSQVAVTRSVPNPDCCPIGNPVRVSLRGNGQGSGPVQLSERYPSAQISGITNVSSGGQVAQIGNDQVITWNVTAAELNLKGVTYDVDVPPGKTAVPEGTVGGWARIGGVREVKGSWPHTGPIGVFEDSHDVGTADGLAGPPGLFSAETGPDGRLGTRDDEYTIAGTGNDVWNEGDSFRFAYRAVKGEFSATVRIAKRTFPATGGRWGRYGLMVRLDCAANSKYSLIHANLEADPGVNADHLRGDAVFWQYRRNHRLNGSNNNDQSLVFPDPDGNGPEIVNQPNFFRLNRRGNTFSGYASFDGKSWKLIGSDTWYGLAPDAAVLVGFMYSRHSSAPQPGSIVFSDFEIGPLAAHEIFDNDAGTPARLVYRSNFAAVPDGGLPSDFSINCGRNCSAAEGFSPRVVNGRLRLTQEGVKSNATSAFIQGFPLPAGTGKIIVEYTVWVTSSGVTEQPVRNNPDPGDGITMAIIAGQNGKRVGLSGAGLGYDGLARGSFTDAAPSFAVEYDCWVGRGDNEGTGSPAADGSWHMGIDAGGNIHSLTVAGSGLPDIFLNVKGVRHRVELTSEGKMSVFLPAGGGQASGGDPILAAQGEPLDSQGDVTAEVGFTGSTGNASQTAEIGDVLVLVEDCSDFPETASVTGPGSAQPGQTIRLDASGSGAGSGDAGEALSFSWRIVSGSDKATLEPLPGGFRADLHVGLNAEDGEVIVGVAVDDHHCPLPIGSSVNHKVQVSSAPLNWSVYDSNDDGTIDISDPIADFESQFSGGPDPACPAAMDFNADGRRDISDPIAALGYLFLGAPPSPLGTDCRSFPGCPAGRECP